MRRFPFLGTRLEHFLRTAQELCCDELEEKFAAKLKALASIKPMTNTEVKKKARRERKKPQSIVNGSLDC